MDNELLEIQERLAKVAVQRQKERLDAHASAMKELAEARSKEETRQAAAKEEKRLAQERASKRKKEAQDAEAARVREEEAEQRLIEQEENRRQCAIDDVLKTRETLRKKLDDLEHAEELAKKELRDAMLRDTTDSIVTNPLQRFLQHTPE